MTLWREDPNSSTVICVPIFQGTFDATIAGMGSDTRRNFRRYRRRRNGVWGSLRAGGSTSESQFLAFNRKSLYLFLPWVVRWRIRDARKLPGIIFAGLRAKDGSWLSSRQFCVVGNCGS